jgi:hypothetical protein
LFICDFSLPLYLPVDQNITATCVFGSATPCRCYTVFWQFAGTYCLHLHQLRRLNELGRLDEGATFLQNGAMYATNPATRLHILEDLKSRSAMFVNVTTSTVKRIRQHIWYFFAAALRPNAGHDLLILEVSRLHTTTQHSR